MAGATARLSASLALLPMLVSRLLGVVREEGPADAARVVTPGIRAAVPLADRAGVAAFLHEVAYLLESNGGQS